MKKLLLALLFAASTGHTAQDCKAPSNGFTGKLNRAQQHYYSATCHFRNRDYQKAVQSWQSLRQLDNIPSSAQHLHVESLSHLAYMKYFGYGTRRNQQLAIQLWEKAVAKGHTEAEYYLCRVFANQSERSYDPARGAKHCRKAQLIYRGMVASNEAVLKRIEQYINDVELVNQLQ